MARSIGSGVRLPRRGCEVNYAPCPLSRGLVLLLRVWPYLLLVPVWPVFGVQLQADLGFLAFPRLCSDALIRRLASRRSPRRRPVFDPGGSRLASRRPPRRRPVFDPGGSHSESALAFRHVALFVRPWLSARARLDLLVASSLPCYSAEGSFALRRSAHRLQCSLSLLL